MSLYKTITYCLMHLVIAVAVALALTGDLAAALAIGVVEPVVQTFAFAAHDRFWSRYDGRRGTPARFTLHAGCSHGGVTLAQLDWSRRLLSVPVLKTASYGVMHLIVAVTVAYALTRSWTVALAVGLVEPAVQTVAFVLHDRAWAKFARRGRRDTQGATAPATAEG